MPPAEQQRLGHTNQNDGTFFMLYDDLVNYFVVADICKIDDNANYLNCEAEFDKDLGQIFELETDGKAPISICVSQPCQRGKVKDE